MRLRTFLVTVLAAASISAFADQTYVPGMLSVKIASGKDSAAVTAIKKAGGTVYRDLPEIGWKVVKFGKNVSIPSVRDSLKKQTAFADVELDGVEQIVSTVDDPRASEQWAINRMQLPQAWDLSKGDTGVVVAVIDTGIDRGHPDLAGRVLPGYDFINNDSDPNDDNGHGTHCAGIIGASTNNGIGVASAGYNVTILPIKAASAAGFLPDDAIAAGILFAANNGAQVVSMSFGGFGTDPMTIDAINFAYKKNILLVAAAGNNNVSQTFYPAGYPHVLAVASSDPDDSKSWFSNYGDWVHVAAPGNNILSTWPRSLSGNGAPYQFDSGTSMACPQVAGVAALLMSYAGPGVLTGDEVTTLLEENTDPVSGTYVHYGRINAFKAIQQVGVKLTDAAVPADPALIDGSIVGDASAAPLKATEGIALTLKGARKNGVGVTGAFATSFDVTQMTLDELKTGTLTITASGDRKATLQVFLWNSLNSKWVLYSAKPMTTTSQSTSFLFTKEALGKYMEGTNMKLMLRVLVPTAMTIGSTGLTQIDQASITFAGVRKPGATP